MRFDNIPELLRKQPQWVAWGVPDELPKVPYSPQELLKLNLFTAKSGVPETWGTFEDAVKCVSMGLAKGIGYEFNGNGIYGVDLDNVIVNGAVIPQAQQVIEQLNSFTEVSPSGKGIHIYVIADNAKITRHRKQGSFIEIYGDKRYFTVTGEVYSGFKVLAKRTAELQEVHDSHFQVALDFRESKAISDSKGISHLQRGLDKDPVLRACWNGERRCGDESASDQALMSKLAYWCSADQSAMIAAFKQSPYYSQKGEFHKKKCERADYLPNTAQRACSTLRSTAETDTHRYHKTRLRGEAR